MVVTKNDNVVCFDVDDTLIMWSWPAEFNDDVITFDNWGHNVQLVPHKKHIELMKQFKARGHYVVVWSQGGFAWAKAVCETLGITHLVDEVKTKPKWCIDDLAPAVWLTRSYMNLHGERQFNDPYGAQGYSSPQEQVKDEDEDN
jgi:hypothetical protein